MLSDLRDLRRKKRMSIRDLAQIADISKSNVHNIENGKVIPGIDTVCRIAYALDMTPEDLFSMLIEGESF